MGREKDMKLKLVEKILVLTLLIFFHVEIIESAPGVQNALVYLSKYGYLEPNQMGNSSQINAKTFKQSLRDFQSFAGLPKTGKLDRRTLTMMSMSRCGVTDRTGSSTGSSGRFVIEGSKWTRKNLNYRITKYPKNLDRGTVDATIQKAFNLWSKYTDLTFERSSNRGNIDIRFEEGQHGDGDGFDGPGGTLAHAFFPQYGGATHFDDTEPWIVNSDRGTDLFQVAAHEFGHALGLAHSDIKDALMAPFYKGFIRDLDLYQDDIRAIQRLYGAKSGSNPPARPRRPTSPRFPKFPSFPGFPRFPNFPNFPSFPGFPNVRVHFFPRFPRRSG